MVGRAIVKREAEKCVRPKLREDSKRYTRPSISRIDAPSELTVDNNHPVYSLDSIDFGFAS